MRQEETKECEEVGCQGEECEDSDSPGALAQTILWMAVLRAPIFLNLSLSCRKSANFSPAMKTDVIGLHAFHFLPVSESRNNCSGGFCLAVPFIVTDLWPLWMHLCAARRPICTAVCENSLHKKKAFSNLFVWKRSEKSLSGVMQHPCNALSCFLIAYPLSTALLFFYISRAPVKEPPTNNYSENLKSKYLALCLQPPVKKINI